MKTISKTFCATSLAAMFAACGSAPTTHPGLPEDIAGDLHHLVYDQVVVNVETSSGADLSLEVEGAGQASRQGLLMMAAAPIGCLQGGPLAGACIAAAPFFPIIAAVRAEKPEKSRADLDEFHTRYAEYGLEGKLAERLLQRMSDEKLPVVAADSPRGDAQRITLHVHVGPPEFEHSGFKNGSIELRLRYTIELRNTSGAVLSRKSHSVRYDFSHDTRSVTLLPQLDEWLEKIVSQGVDDMLLAWQPAMHLAYVYPGQVEKRTFIGVKHREWVPVDTLMPRLEWEALDKTMPQERLAGISELSYEVVVWGYVDGNFLNYWKRKVLHEVRGLPEPAYTFESELLPCQRYYWQPRARFRYKGAIRTTSLSESFTLLTPGPDCGVHRYTLPPVELPPA